MKLKSNEKKQEYYFKTFASPVGELKLVASSKGLVAVLWENDDPKRISLGLQIENSKNTHLLSAEKQLSEYFLGTRKSFDLKLDFKGTDFQKNVWQELLAIPYGETRTYGQIAKKIKRPKAYRAVGAANGRNPVSIVAACHRVIGASGALTGFAGGLKVKSFLLNLEQLNSQR